MQAFRVSNEGRVACGQRSIEPRRQGGAKALAPLGWRRSPGCRGAVGIHLPLVVAAKLHGKAPTRSKRAAGGVWMRMAGMQMKSGWAVALRKPVVCSACRVWQAIYWPSRRERGLVKARPAGNVGKQPVFRRLYIPVSCRTVLAAPRAVARAYLASIFSRASICAAAFAAGVNRCGWSARKRPRSSALRWRRNHSPDCPTRY